MNPSSIYANTVNMLGTTNKFNTQSQRSAANGFLTREGRVRAFGVDCADDITWTVWGVGGEYERRLLIKNTFDKRQVISYKLPKQKATFFVEFPEPATISSGMSYSLVVRFRPLELVEHHDELEVLVKGRGSFKVRLDAFTPYAHLTTPPKFDFNMCPVNVSSQHTFSVKNTGTVPLTFFWEVPAPFALEPAKGFLREGQSLDMAVRFTPRSAVACVGQAICRLAETNDIIAVMNFSGIGKFGFLRIKGAGLSTSGAGGGGALTAGSPTSLADGGVGPDNLIDFGDILTSASEVRYISLVNPSFVDCDFDLRLLNPDITSAFTIVPTAGTVPRGGEMRLAIKFSPKNSGAHYNSDYSVHSASCASTAKFRCTGTAIGPRVFLSASSVDFGDVDIEKIYKDPTNIIASTAVVPTGRSAASLALAAKAGGGANGSPKAGPLPCTVEKWVTVNNDSELPIRFHFAGCDPGCAFKVTPSSGSLKPRSSTNVKIAFSPTNPINHLRRLFVMTTAGEAALILDVFGTGYTSKIRPAPFDSKAVQLFFSKIEYGLGGMTPEEAEKLIASMNMTDGGGGGAVVAAAAGFGSTVDDAARMAELQRGAQEAFRLAVEEVSLPKKKRAGFASVFPKSVGQRTFPFIMDRTEVSIRHESMGQAESVVIRNTTSSKATASWAVPSGGPDSEFSAAFSDPSSPSQQQQYWVVEPQSQDVPAFGTATFRVMCAPNAPPQTFGAFLECYVNYKTMRSFRLVNEDVFTPPHCLLLQCTHLAPYRENGPVPAVKLAPSVCFQPCRSERSVYQVLELVNEGDTAIAYDLLVESSMVPDKGNAEYFSEGSAVDEEGNPIAPDPEEDAISTKRRALLETVFQAFPASGILPAKGSYMVLVKFTPPLPSKFYGALHISYNGAPTANGSVLLKGEGFVPRVKLDCDSLLAFRPTTTGGSTTRQYTITNLSRIPVAFRATVPPALADILRLEPSAAVLRGSEAFRVTATFSPREAKLYTCDIPIVISVPSDLAGEADAPPLLLTATATATATPTTATTPTAAGEAAQQQLNGLSSTFFRPRERSIDESVTQLCTLRAEGHAPYLSLEPLSRHLGDVGVGGPTSFPLTLYNTGLSDVCFEMRYVLRSVDAHEHKGVEGAAAVSAFSSGNTVDPVTALVMEAAAKEAAANKHVDANSSRLIDTASGSVGDCGTTADGSVISVLTADNGQLVTFGPAPTGVIRARSHHTVSVSTKLALRGKHEIIAYVVCGGNVEALKTQYPAGPLPALLAGVANEGSTRSDTELASRSSVGILTNTNANNNTIANNTDTAVNNQTFEAFLTRLPHCRITANGLNACLQIADARCVYQQKSKLWRQMSINKINAVLAEEVGRADEQMRALSFDDSLAALSPIRCNLGVDAFHAAPIRIYVALANTSSTSVDFRFRFPIDNEIPKEPWHADQRGLDDPIAHVVDKALFDVSPRTGTVAPNDQVIVTFTYFHSEVGRHQLPVILRVEEGKQVLLMVEATTIAEDGKHLAFHHEMDPHTFVPVAIGDVEPPIQYTEMQNMSAASISYAVDEAPLLALKDANYDFPILQCLNPTGVIPPMETVLVSWFFRPLEAKDYAVTTTVSVEGGSSYKLTLAGKGYHPKLLTNKAVRAVFETMFPMPRVPTMEIPAIPVRLSTDALRFGSVPFHSYHRRHVSLTNTHTNDTFLFEWRPVLQHGDQIFEVEPARGSIEPGVTVHFCVSMFSGSFSHIIDTAVHCHVVNESLRLRRAERVAQLEEQLRLEMDQKPETAMTDFAGTSSSSQRSGRVGAAAAAAASGGGGGDGGISASGRALRPRHRHAITTVPPKYQSTQRLQKTIQKLEEMALAEEVDENADEWAHVEVAPTIVELLIQCRIMPLGHYKEVYGEDAAGVLFFPTMLGKMHPMRPSYSGVTVPSKSAKGSHNTNNYNNNNNSKASAAAAHAAAVAAADGDLRHAALAAGRPDSVLSDVSLTTLMQQRRAVAAARAAKAAFAAENEAQQQQQLIDDLSPPLADVTSTERDIVLGCLREILRAVVHSPGLLDTLNDPSEDPVPYYCELIASNKNKAGAIPSAISEFICEEEEAEEGGEGQTEAEAKAAEAARNALDNEEEEEEGSGAGLPRASHDRSNNPSDHPSASIPSLAPGGAIGIGIGGIGRNASKKSASALAAAAAEAEKAEEEAYAATANFVRGQLSSADLLGEGPTKENKGEDTASKRKHHHQQQQQQQQQRIKPPQPSVPGDVQCIAEEVLADVVFYLVSQALTAEGVVTQGLDVARRQRRASEARLNARASEALELLGYATEAAATANQ